MTTQTISIKQGATLSLAGTVLLSAGTWDAECEVKNAAGTKVADLAVTLTALDPATDTATHTITIIGTSVQTALLAAENHRCDVRFFDDSTPPVVIDSPTFVIKVSGEITHVG